MVASIPAAFEQLRRNLELTGLQQSVVSTRQRNVRSAIEDEFVVVDSFLAGSYVRQTQIGPLAKADVDIVVVLDHQYYDRGARSVLDMLRRALLKTYTRTPRISRNGQAVTVTFADFVIDVVPAFKQHPWFGAYEICDSGSDSWIQTDPKKHSTISSTANNFHNGRLIPCVKQLKAWNRTASSPLRSFHIEVLAWEVFGSSVLDFLLRPSMGRDWGNVRNFFDRARTLIEQRQADPAGTGKDVGAYLTGQSLARAKSKITTAFERCVRAEQETKEGRLSAAHDAYRRVFGDYYPATS